MEPIDLQTLGPETDGFHFEEIVEGLKHLFCILIHIPLQCLPKGLIDNKTALVQVISVIGHPWFNLSYTLSKEHFEIPAINIANIKV